MHHEHHTPAPGAQGELSALEIKKRVAVLGRFRELLLEQRDRFQNYLVVLDKQKTVIESGSADDLSEHIKMEEKIIADIFTIQKSIAPLRMVFGFAEAGGTQADGAAAEAAELQSCLEALKDEAVLRVNENKKLLQVRLNVLRSDIKNIRANPFALKRRQLYTESASASLLDIEG
ncbi:MAG: flagellar biosynthesis protein FlgN [Spirochaetaceae bacterium]|jgi:hypothetical protein|nr:flagellar biosynthesis protein FlgN [Spirochaetaceae bacterium]